MTNQNKPKHVQSKTAERERETFIITFSMNATSSLVIGSCSGLNGFSVLVAKKKTNKQQIIVAFA